MAMIAKQRWGFVLVLILAVGTSTRGADEVVVLAQATTLLEEISASPDSGIPAKFLQEARGILIVPHLVENQLGVGRKIGHGVYLARNDKGEWGNPQFLTVTGLSAGAEVGHMVTELVMIYRTQKAADQHALVNNTFSVEAEAHLARRHLEFSGPEATTSTKKETLVYSRSHGLLVGARIGGEHKIWAAQPRVELLPPVSAAATPTTTPIARREPVPTAPLAEATPEEARLKRVLTALTGPPSAQVAAANPRDSQVSPASVVKPAALSAGSP